MSSEEENRKELVEKLRNQGVNPYAYEFDRSHKIEEVVEEYGEEEEEDLPEEEFRLAGRIMEIRSFGGIAFLDLRGERDEIQVLTRDEDTIEFIEEYLHNGDIIGAEGTLTYTKKGEFSLETSNIELLTKGVRPIPSDYFGLEDQETIYRDRPLHLILDMDAKEIFRKRSEIISETRRFLEKREFMEVETPAIQPVYGGANATPFTTYVADKDMDAYLSISPELYLKRIIVGGYERVFEITKNFRNESIDRTHNPEFTMMELYQTYADYEDMMELTEQLYEHLAQEVLGTTEIEYQGHNIDLSAPWKRMTMREAIQEHGGFDVEELSDEEIKQKMEEHDAELDSSYERGLAIEELFEEVAEEHLIQPVHITDYPQETTPLCMDHREKEGLIERFESFIAGMEMGNAYTELRDPLQQRKHFEAEQRRQDEGDDEAHPIDMDFVEALELGMPPTGGLGIGIDRMVMLMTDQESIRDVIFFPMVK